MKIKNHLVLLALLAFAGAHPVIGQGTAFTYQGQLSSNGTPATGVFDFQFALFDTASGGNLLAGISTRLNVGVTNGVFSTTVDFGSAFGGNPTWMEVGVRTNGAGAFTTLAPRPAVTASPYAIFAENIASNTVGPANLQSGAVSSANVALPLILNGSAAATGIVQAENLGNGDGIDGFGVAGDGVQGFSSTGSGVKGTSSNGDGLTGYSSYGRGVSGFANAAGANIAGVWGENSAGDGTAVVGKSLAGSGTGVYGSSAGSGTGVSGKSVGGDGVYGSTGGNGVHGLSTGPSGSGVWGENVNATSGNGVAGNSSGGNGVAGNSSGGNGVYGITASASATAAGVWGENDQSGGTGVVGKSTATTGTGVYGASAGYGTGVSGYSNEGEGINGTSSLWIGIHGVTSSSAAAVEGENDADGNGVYGISAGGIGVSGTTFSTATDAAGVYGSSGYGNGVYGVTSTGAGVHGYTPAGSAGVWGETDADGGVGVYGTSVSGVAVKGLSGIAVGVYGGSSTAGPAIAGVWGENDANGGTAIVGKALGSGSTGIYAKGTGNAAYLDGNVHVTGALSVAGTKNFKIDHPLDPAHKYLVHACVESPDVMNIYNGNITTDPAGEATVTLPGYFEALNRDYRYQLTVLGQFAQAIVWEKVKGNRFTIKTDKPNVEVSWQVTGVRQDAYIQAHPMIVEQDKPVGERAPNTGQESSGQPSTEAIARSR